MGNNNFCMEYNKDFNTDGKYSEDAGFGIIEPLNADDFNRGDYKFLKMTDSEIALKNGGWNKRRLKEPMENKAIEGGADAEKNSDAKDSAKRNRNVTIFKAKVPEFGTLTAGEEDISHFFLFSGRRNMVSKDLHIKKGEKYVRSFYQAVLPYIPALTSKRTLDKSLYVSYAGIPETSDCRINIRITRKEVPVIFVAGDSTLTDQNAGIPYYPYGSCCGWAQTLLRYTKEAAVYNLSHSGMTSNCFRDDGHYDIVLEYAKPGDVCILQFGHNDQKRRNLSAFGGYKDNLVKYVRELRKMGVEPVICSPISRVPLELTDEEMKEANLPKRYSLLWDHAKAAREAAKEENVVFVDLHQETFNKWISVSDKAKDYFIPGDVTHTNEYGACFIADYFFETIKKESQDFVLNKLLGQNDQEDYFDPDSDVKKLPQEIPGPEIFEIEPPYVDIKDSKEYPGIEKAFKYGLLDPCVMYLHPKDVMPRGQVLMVMFNAFRIAGVRPYKNKFADVKADEWIAGYVQGLINRDLIDPETIKQQGKELYFRPDDALTFGEFAEFMVNIYEKKNLSMDEAMAKAIRLGIFDGMDPQKNANVNRGEVYTALARCVELCGKAKDNLPKHPVH